MHKENNIANLRISQANQQDVLAGNAASSSYRPYSNLFFPYVTDNAGTNEDISLTITRFKNKNSQTSFVNEKWDSLPSGFLPNNDYTWGFKETFNPFILDSNISNAFAFNDQTMRVYIDAQGGMSGYFGDKWGYAKTTISVIGTDLVSGVQTTLKVFSDLDISADDSSRYFNITMPSISSSAMSNYLLGGIYVVSLNVSYEIFKDMNFEEKLDIGLNIEQQHNLQILLFSYSSEAKNVTSPFTLFKETIDGDESFNELFVKSVFSDYDGVNANSLNDDQKRAAISDQLAALFISQHPVATSENYPCKILGLGVEESISPKYVIEKAYTYSKRHPEIIPLINSRLYGMLLNYKTFALSSELDKYFSDFSQSLQKIRDPSRIIAIKEDGRVDFDFGIDGLLFNPFSIETLNAETPKKVNKSAVFSISLKNKNVEINNINITDPDLIDNLALEIVSPFDNSTLTCPSLSVDAVLINGDVPCTKLYVRKGQNVDIFSPVGDFSLFNLVAEGILTGSKNNLYLDDAMEITMIQLYTGPSCYFVLEGTRNGKTWKFKSNGYNLTGRYNLLSYSSTDGSANPYPTETYITVLSEGEMQREYYQYKPFENNKVNLSFEPVFGESLIKRIRYSIWARESLTWMEYVDETGLTRNHTFDLTQTGGVGVKTINNVPVPCGIINAKIDIEDEYGFTNSFYQDYFIPNDRSYPSILSISGNQSLDGTGSIDVYYNYLGTSEVNNTKTTLNYSTDGSTWAEATDVSGDVGIAVQPGFRKMKWNPWLTISSQLRSVYVKVSLVDVDGATNISRWENSSIAIPIDIRKPVVDIRRLAQDEIEVVYESSSSSNSSFSSSTSTSSFSSEEYSSSSFYYPIKNLILFVGDGMGINHQEAASMYKTGLTGQLLWQNSFDAERTLTTYSLSGVTDSAASATAFATGANVANQVISTVSALDATPVRTILEYAHENGKLSGLVTTTRISDATIAAFAAHRTSRYSYEGIVEDFYTIKPHVLFGQTGGSNNLDAANAASAGYVVATDTWEMLNLDINDGMVFGQFTPTTDTYADERCNVCLHPETPKLNQMTEKAIELLSENEEGFFLVVEGALIDHAADGGGVIADVVGETLDLEEAVQVAYDWASQRNDTMIVLLSDHETGGMNINSPTLIGVTPDVTFTSTVHTGRDVKVYAWGPQAGDLNTFSGIPGPDLRHADVFRFMMEKLFPMESTSSSSSSVGISSSSSSMGTSSSSSSTMGTSSSSSTGDVFMQIYNSGYAHLDGNYYWTVGDYASGKKAFTKDFWYVIEFDGGQWFLNDYDPAYGNNMVVAYFNDEFATGYPVDGINDSYNAAYYPASPGLAVNTSITKNNV